MNLQLAAFITASFAVHAGLLAWVDRESPVELHIGGQAEALQISLVRPSANTSVASELAAVEVPPAPTRERPAIPAIVQRSLPTRISRQVKVEPTADTPLQPDSLTTEVPASGSTESTRQASSINISQQISAALQNQLARRFEYPWLARKRGWQGKVTLSLRIEDNGNLTDWAVTKTSGYSVLDRSALKAARAIQSLPEARGLLDGKSLQLQIPVEYQLIGG